MSLVPAFEIGAWSAWIFAVYQLLTVPLLFRIAGKRGSTSDENLNLSATQRVIATSTKLLLFPALIYSIFLPLPLGTVWFYIGLIIFLLGLIVYVMPSKGILDIPPDKPFTKGLYRYSRHPIYMTMVLELIG